MSFTAISGEGEGDIQQKVSHLQTSFCLNWSYWEWNFAHPRREWPITLMKNRKGVINNIFLLRDKTNARDELINVIEPDIVLPVVMLAWSVWMWLCHLAPTNILLSSARIMMLERISLSWIVCLHWSSWNLTLQVSPKDIYISMPKEASGFWWTLFIDFTTEA